MHGKALRRRRKQYGSKLYKEEEVRYPNCFFVQLGVCAAFFLLLMGLQQVQTEPVRAVLAGIRSVATTEVELGRAIGKLKFVGNFMPESVMVYWNVGTAQLIAPFEDAVLLNERDGWAVFEGNGALLCGGEGRVADVARCENGYRLTIAYDSGLECVMEPMQGVRVAAGERVHLGQNVGMAAIYGSCGQVRVQVLSGGTALPADTWLR